MTSEMLRKAKEALEAREKALKKRGFTQLVLTAFGFFRYNPKTKKIA